MFKLENEESLLAAFRPRDRKLVQLTPEVSLPVIVTDYLAWVHPAGGRVYLVFAVPKGAPTGVVFDTLGASGEPVPNMCDWCHSSSLGTVGLLSAYLNAKKRVGVNICTDLSCKKKLEEDAARSGRSPIPAIEKLIERMGRFADESLKIDLSGLRR